MAVQVTFYTNGWSTTIQGNRTVVRKNPVIHTKILHRLVLLSLLFVFTGACDGCKKDSEPVAATQSDPAPAPVPEPEPEVDGLAEARKQAEQLAEAVFLHVSDQAQFVAADIEAASHRPAPLKRQARPQEPETGEIKNMAEFRRVLSSHQGAMQSCYERALRRNPSLQGRVTLNLLISSSGKVAEARAQGGGMREAGVTDCMESHAKTMSFPKPEGGAVRMNVPYVFNPQL
jgi:hypothetical protein